MRFNHIAIVGVGLIGGSFALAARRAGIAGLITGCDSKDVLQRACALGVIDGTEESFGAEMVSDADLVYLAAPVGAIIEFLRTRGPFLKTGTIVTDAGSTKREICRAAREALPSQVSFVGGHPMAGSDYAGVEHADADLFRDAPYALVAGDLQESPAARAVESVVLSIGATPVKLTAEEHDRIVARVSHAPQLLTTALASGVNEADLGLAGSGFTGLARLAGSPWSVWEDICRSNSDEITLALDEVIGELEAIRLSVATGDFAAVGVTFNKANELIKGLRARSDRGDSRSQKES